MAEESYTDIVTPAKRFPSSSILSDIEDVSRALGMDKSVKEAAKQFIFLTLKPPTNPNASTVDSHPFKVPFPCRLVYADMNVRNENGAAATGDLMVNRAAGGYTSQLNAAEALTADTVSRVAPETTAVSSSTGGGLLKDDLLIFRVIGSGSGEIVGAEVNVCLQVL